jgi:hypothetical protein
MASYKTELADAILDEWLKVRHLADVDRAMHERSRDAQLQWVLDLEIPPKKFCGCARCMKQQQVPEVEVFDQELDTA